MNRPIPLRPGEPRPPGGVGPGASPDARAAAPRRTLPKSPAAWAHGVFVLQFICQLLLAFVDVGAARVGVRIAAYGVSLALLAFLPGWGKRHPASKAAMAVMGIVGLSLFHPTTNGVLAGGAQIGMYLAILAPLFWGARLKMDIPAMRKALLIIWAFHTVSSGFGVLQVYYPGRFQPNLSRMIAGQGDDYMESLRITTASGERTFRPMGLTDTPGGAAMAGFYAFMLGTGFFLSARKLWFRALCVGSMCLGITALYLSYVRSVLVLLFVSMLAMTAMLVIRGQLKRLVTLASVVSAVAIFGMSLAVALGGEGVLKRVGTLLESEPGEVYYRNRGHFLEHTLEELLPEYPLGAGLARWGMMNVYFGDRSLQEANSIWVEIQWTGWLLDGGVPLILAYSAAVLLAIWIAFRVAMGRLGAQHDGLWILAVQIFAYNVGALALTFNFPFFHSQSGMEFWILNALLYTAALTTAQAVQAKPARKRKLPLALRGRLA